MTTKTEPTVDQLINILRAHPALPAGSTSQLTPATDPQPGDVLYGYGHARYRAGVVVYVGPKRVKIRYVTQGALDEALRNGQWILSRVGDRTWDEYLSAVAAGAQRRAESEHAAAVAIRDAGADAWREAETERLRAAGNRSLIEVRHGRDYIGEEFTRHAGLANTPLAEYVNARITPQVQDADRNHDSWQFARAHDGMAIPGTPLATCGRDRVYLTS